REYISETQKMRAYRGKIEPNSPLGRQAAAAAAAPAPAPAPEPEPKPAPPPPAPKPAPEKKAAAPRPIGNPTFDAAPQPGSQGLTNVLAVGAIVILSIAAIGLIVALVMK